MWVIVLFHCGNTGRNHLRSDFDPIAGRASPFRQIDGQGGFIYIYGHVVSTT
jgi:hypothetical protein